MIHGLQYGQYMYSFKLHEGLQLWCCNLDFLEDFVEDKLLRQSKKVTHLLPSGIHIHFLEKLDKSALFEYLFCQLCPLLFMVFLDNYFLLPS